jgi:hypothetical protein
MHLIKDRINTDFNIRMYPVYQDPTVHSYSHGSMNINQMKNMVFGSPTPYMLPIGCYKLANGGMINPTVNHAQGYILEKRPNLVKEGLKMIKGGKLNATRGRPPSEILVKMKTKGVDNIPALLQGGEIVIPKKFASKVSKMLKKEHIKLPNM